MTRLLARLSPVNQFMLLSAAILLLGAAFIGWWIDGRIVEIATEDSLRIAGAFVDSTIAPHLEEIEELKDILPAQQAHLLQLMRNNVESGRYVAINVWEVDGSLAYSTLQDPSPNGTERVGVARALTGPLYSIATATINGQTSTNAPADGSGHYLETYFAVHSSKTGAPLGVISFDQDMQDLRATLLYVRLQSWFIVGIATTLMYLLLSGVVRRANDTIEVQQRALDRSRRHIQQAALRAAALNEASMRRLGADLHDGPAQDLGIALMRMEPLRQAFSTHDSGQGLEPMDFDSAAFDLELIHTALLSSLREVRNMAGGLRLPELTDLDVAQTIRKAAQDYIHKTGRDSVHVEGPASLAGGDALKSAAYRIVQEALNNGHRHGAPTHQSVKFAVNAGNLLLEISDDGCGFLSRAKDAPPAAPQNENETRRRLGLAGLRERAEILGGALEVRSAPGEGTLVRAQLPLAPDVDGVGEP